MNIAPDLEDRPPDLGATTSDDFDWATLWWDLDCRPLRPLEDKGKDPE